VKIVITCKFSEWAKMADGCDIDHDITVVLEDIPEIGEQTCAAILAPKGWCTGYCIYRKMWNYESLGKPDIDPNDNAAMMPVLLRAEWPTVKFVLPTSNN
jgi:hypothetical protein